MITSQLCDSISIGSPVAQTAEAIATAAVDEDDIEQLASCMPLTTGTVASRRGGIARFSFRGVLRHEEGSAGNHDGVAKLGLPVGSFFDAQHELLCMRG